MSANVTRGEGRTVHGGLRNKRPACGGRDNGQAWETTTGEITCQKRPCQEEAARQAAAAVAKLRKAAPAAVFAEPVPAADAEVIPLRRRDVATVEAVAVETAPAVPHPADILPAVLVSDDQFYEVELIYGEDPKTAQVIKVVGLRASSYDDAEQMAKQLIKVRVSKVAAGWRPAAAQMAAAA